MSANQKLMSKRFRDLLMKPNAFVCVNNLQAGAHIIRRPGDYSVDIYCSVTKRTVKKWLSRDLIRLCDKNKICTYFKLNDFSSPQKFEV